ncbi:hypothetical protein GGR57DRAFT_517155 [Xylariaceae sp. FL1272]|nr:hypothetical protein GGR57DRAFT_517155 [Xylariaceae sp. FL1272]
MASLSDEAIRQQWAAAAAHLGPWSWCLMLSAPVFESLGRYGQEYYIAQSSALWGPTAYYYDGVTSGMMILTSKQWIEFRSIHVHHSPDRKYPTLFPPFATKSSKEESINRMSNARDVASSDESTTAEHTMTRANASTSSSHLALNTTADKTLTEERGHATMPATKVTERQPEDNNFSTQSVITGPSAQAPIARETTQDSNNAKKRGQDQVDAEDNQRKKRARKTKEPKPPGHIPNMTNGWSLFKKTMTPSIRVQYPESKFNDWSSIASKMWRDLTDQQRGEWLVRARDEHQKRFPEYTPSMLRGSLTQSVAEFAASLNYELPTSETRESGFPGETKLAFGHGLQFPPQAVNQYGNSPHDQSVLGHGSQFEPQSARLSGLQLVPRTGYQLGADLPSQHTNLPTRPIASGGMGEQYREAQHYDLLQMSNHHSTGTPEFPYLGHQGIEASRINSSFTAAYDPTDVDDRVGASNSLRSTVSHARACDAASGQTGFSCAGD